MNRRQGGAQLRLASFHSAQGSAEYSVISEGYALGLRRFINSFFSSYINVRRMISLEDAIQSQRR